MSLLRELSLLGGILSRGFELGTSEARKRSEMMVGIDSRMLTCPNSLSGNAFICDLDYPEMC